MRGPRSLWLQEALRGGDDCPPLHGDMRADVCIVGGGFVLSLWAKFEAVARKERAEDRGRRPSARTLAIARLAPAGLVPVNE